MTKRHLSRFAILSLIALAVFVLPGIAMAVIAGHVGAGVAYIVELVVIVALVGAFILLDKISWSLMTTRR